MKNKQHNITKIIVFFVLAILLSQWLIATFQESFSAEKWHKQPTTRYKLIDDMLSSQNFVGKTKADIKILLGTPNAISTKTDTIFIYDVGKPMGFFKDKEERLLLFFSNNRVTRLSLAL